MSHEKEIILPVYKTGEQVLLKEDLSGDKLWARGPDVPGTIPGYAKGCIFIQTDGGTTTTFYVNVGSRDTANFDAPLP
jgi:hypothetical protein